MFSSLKSAKVMRLETKRHTINTTIFSSQVVQKLFLIFFHQQHFEHYIDFMQRYCLQNNFKLILQTVPYLFSY